MANKQRLGIIQSRGLGDLIIALPIADYYRQQGRDIYWPICEEFMSSMTQAVPWVHWIPIPTDSGSFFYDVPRQRLKNLGVEEVICLYQSLTGHPEFAQRPEFQITGFDQIKYHIAGVPFLRKWLLKDCIIRNPEREHALKDRLKIKDNEPYVVVHLEGSDYKTAIDPSWIPQGWRTIEVTAITDSIFDWIGVLEGAESIIAVDSVMANLVDQLGIADQVDSYFLPRSHIHLTPVLGCAWTVLDPSPDVLRRITIFR